MSHLYFPSVCIDLIAYLQAYLAVLLGQGGASSAFEMAGCKSSISPVGLYRSDRIVARLFSRPAWSGRSSEVVESASSAFEMAVGKLFIFPVQYLHLCVRKEYTKTM